MNTIIKVRCTDQVLTFENTPVIASGGLGEDFIAFDFCSKWDGFVKTAVFWRTEAAAYHVVLDDAGRVAIPTEVLQDEGVIYFGVFGVNADGTQRTSEVLNYRIVKGAITTGTKPSDPTPEIYTQLLQQYAAIVSMYQSKADKVTGATEGNLAALDADGNLVDSGKNGENLITPAERAAWNAKEAGGTAAAQTAAHNVDAEAHADIRAAVNAAAGAANSAAGAAGAAQATADEAKTAAGAAQATADEAKTAAGEAKTVAESRAPAVRYGTTEVEAGAVSSYPDGTLYVVIE